MRIENLRIMKREILFAVVGVTGDINIGDVCLGCPLERLGCSHETNMTKKIISARVNLDSPRVQILKNKNENVNCPAGRDIKFKA